MYMEYRVNARNVERQFKREVTKIGYFQTAKGCINHLVDYGKTDLHLKTGIGKEPIRLKRNSIRKAINFFFFKRTAIRSDFESFSSFTSAVFAIILHCFKDKSKLQKLKNGLFRISLLSPRFFFGGLERDKAILKILKSLNGKFVLFNYKSIQESPHCIDHLDEFDFYCLIDSGSFPLYNAKKKESKKVFQQQKLFSEDNLDDMMLEGYAQFINENKTNPRILGFFPFDCIGNPTKTRDNFSKLKKLTDAKIYPVWQFTDSLEELDRLVLEEHEMYGIGGMVPFISTRKHIIKEVLDKVMKRHPTVNFHALGIADELLVNYNIFFSADSTAFLNARKWADGRKVYISNGERIDAPEAMSTIDIIKQNITYLIGLEIFTDTQLSFRELLQEGA